MPNISQFFKGDTRKKNRKIFVGPSSNVTWTAPPSTTEVDVHVWGGGGDGHTSSAAKNAGGGGGYVGNTFAVVGGSTVVISCGAPGGTSTAVVTNPNGPSTLTATGGYPGYSPTPAPNYGVGGSGSHSLHPAEPTAYVFTANGGNSRVTSLKSTPQCTNSAGGGGAGFIYGPGGDSGSVPTNVPDNGQHPTAPGNQGQGGGGFRGDGGWAGRGQPSFPYKEVGGAGGGFMPADGNGARPEPGAGNGVNFGGAGIDGRYMVYSQLGQSDSGGSDWFYLEDINGMGGSSGQHMLSVTSSPTGIQYRSEMFANKGLAGGGGAGAQPQMSFGGPGNGGPGKGGDGGIFGGGGGGTGNGTDYRAGNGGLAGGGGGGRGTDHPQPTIAGLGGAGCVILYW